jgi:hypothetical protein
MSADTDDEDDGIRSTAVFDRSVGREEEDKAMAKAIERRPREPAIRNSIPAEAASGQHLHMAMNQGAPSRPLLP